MLNKFNTSQYILRTYILLTLYSVVFPTFVILQVLLNIGMQWSVVLHTDFIGDVNCVIYYNIMNQFLQVSLSELRSWTVHIPHPPCFPSLIQETFWWGSLQANCGIMSKHFWQPSNNSVWWDIRKNWISLHLFYKSKRKLWEYCLFFHKEENANVFSSEIISINRTQFA